MAFQFEFTPEQRLLRRSMRQFLRTEIEPNMPADDWTGHGGDTPLHLVKKIQERGLFGLPIPEEYGGPDMGEPGYCIMMEEISMVDAGLTTVFGAHTGIGLMPMYLFGNEDQRERFVRPVAEGKAITAFALTEPTAGSDAASIKTTAVKQGDEYVLNGTKIWCSNGNFADFVIVFAVTDPILGAHGGVTAFVVEKGTPGFNVGTIEDKLGIRSSNTAELIFDNCHVPKENIIGKVGEGFIAALTALDGGRVGLAAATMGSVKRILEDTVQRVKARERFGKPIGENQSIQWMLADMATDLYHAEYAVYHAAELTNEYYHRIAAGKPVPRSLREQVSRAAAATKIFSSEMAGRAGENMIKIFGGDGIKARNRIDQGFRDQIITEIYEGTNEIQRMILGRELLSRGGYE